MKRLCGYAIRVLTRVYITFRRFCLYLFFSFCVVKKKIVCFPINKSIYDEHLAWPFILNWIRAHGRVGESRQVSLVQKSKRSRLECYIRRMWTFNLIECSIRETKFWEIALFVGSKRIYFSFNTVHFQYMYSHSINC